MKTALYKEKKETEKKKREEQNIKNIYRKKEKKSLKK